MHRRSVLALLPTSLTLFMVSLAGCSEPVGMTDEQGERTAIRIVNRDDEGHQVGIEARIDEKTVISKIVQVGCGESLDLKKRLSAPSGNQQYRLDVRLENGTTKSDSFTTNDGFDMVRIVINGDGINIAWIDAS